MQKAQKSLHDGPLETCQQQPLNHHQQPIVDLLPHIIEKVINERTHMEQLTGEEY